ncbi:MAG TPA: FKBP-type peptidyl-prolyl cis-trans isomerase [Gemmatimonadetes bacterium]|nr:FKBP-type peptidyl-prolyl cis-trans isomerase [Gemmatimonadota bacterium]
MRHRSNWTAIFAVTTLAACQAGGTGGTASLETDDEIASYGFGLDIGRSLEPTVSHLERGALMRGIEDALDGVDPAVAVEQLAEVTQRVGTLIREEQNAEFEALTETNRVEGEAFLASNADKDGVSVTASGLQYEVITEGAAGGAQPTITNQVTIHYRGTLLDGTEFDSSYSRGQPATFGVTGVIQGFSEGLQLMTPGSHYRFFIPSDMAYGPQGTGPDIGPNATLIFEIELIEVI